MHHAQQILQTHPGAPTVSRELLACLAACHDCEAACLACADACLSEENVKHMVGCIRLDRDCAAVCGTLGAVLARGTASGEPLTALLDACIAACKACADECERHGKMGMEHCRVCAEACRACEQACRQLRATG